MITRLCLLPSFLRGFVPDKHGDNATLSVYLFWKLKDTSPEHKDKFASDIIHHFTLRKFVRVGSTAIAANRFRRERAQRVLLHFIAVNIRAAITVFK